jgi:fermentation-respiration switch protein FrsA (DUF1100 family)
MKFFPLLLLTGLFFPSPVAAMLEHHFLFFPDQNLHTTPAADGLSYEEIDFPAADGTPLHGWYLPGPEGRPLVLFCHGNAGNIADRVEILRFLHDLGLAVFIFDYRGYGRSQGQASEAGTYDDGRGALDWLAGRGWRPDRMIYFGRSLGAAIALQLALERPPAGLVLESPFTSVAAMGRHHYPLLSRLLGWLLTASYDSLARIADLRTQLLIVHGRADRVVPVAMGEELYRRAPEPKRLLLLPGIDHNDLFFFGPPEYRAAWQTLAAEVPSGN